MHESDIKILLIIDELIELGLVKNKTDFCRKIRMTPETIGKIKRGINHFTAAQVQIICDLFYVNANYIFGIEENMFYKK